MGYDAVSIVSMNSAGQDCLPKGHRGSYLSQLLNGLKPDIGILPGDNPDLKKNMVVGYEQHMSETRSTLLLYDANKIEMKRQYHCDNAFNGLFGLDPRELAWPEVVVSSLAPSKTVLKTITLVSIPHLMFNTERVTMQIREKLLDSLVLLAQRMAIVTENPLLIAGDIRLPMNKIREIISARNKTTQQQFLSDQQQFLDLFMPSCYLPSMTKGSTRDVRQTFKMEPVQCKPTEPIVKNWNSEQTAEVFIASKCLDMSEAKGIRVQEALGRQVRMAAVEKACVTKTEIQIPVRPPKHHGG